MHLNKSPKTCFEQNIHSHGPCHEMVHKYSWYTITLPVPWYSSQMFPLYIMQSDFQFSDNVCIEMRSLHTSFHARNVFLGWDIIHLQLWKHDCDLRADLSVRQDRDTDGHSCLLQDVCYRTVAVESCNRQRPDNKPITFTWPAGSLAGLYYSWLVWCTVKNAVTWLREVGGRDKTIKRPVSV